MLKFCNHNQRDTSHTLTIGNQSEVPIRQYISVTFFSLMETNSTYFINPLASVEIMHIILGTTTFEKNIKK